MTRAKITGIVFNDDYFFVPPGSDFQLGATPSGKPILLVYGEKPLNKESNLYELQEIGDGQAPTLKQQSDAREVYLCFMHFGHDIDAGTYRLTVAAYPATEEPPDINNPLFHFYKSIAANARDSRDFELAAFLFPEQELRQFIDAPEIFWPRLRAFAENPIVSAMAKALYCKNAELDVVYGGPEAPPQFKPNTYHPS